MKLESLSIRDFRCIESLDLSFKDDLDLIRDCIPIVGPNTSGKTTILYAIALCLMPVADVHQLREGLRPSPPSMVRSGAIRTRVSSTVWFSDDEIEATREVLDRTGNLYHYPVPTENNLAIHWTFPDPEGRLRTGDYRFEPANGWHLTLGRKDLANQLHVPGLGPRLFQRLGSVFTFDQRRTGLPKSLSPKRYASSVNSWIRSNPEETMGMPRSRSDLPSDRNRSAMAERRTLS